MNKPASLLLALFLSFAMAGARGQTDEVKTDKGTLKIIPILHGTLAFQWNGLTIFNDPYGGADLFKELPAPDLVFITDIHGDHLNQETLDGLDLSKATLIVPQAVADQLPEPMKSKAKVLANGEKTAQKGLQIEALPMYNLPESPDSRHTKGRGNGYIITFSGRRIYISGDTSDIPEMRNLTNIDVAFVCMNLPYTMSVEQAADAVTDFKPAIVYPFHYRGQGGLADVGKFKELVNAETKDVEVRLRKWYPSN